MRLVVRVVIASAAARPSRHRRRHDGPHCDVGGCGRRPDKDAWAREAFPFRRRWMPTLVRRPRLAEVDRRYKGRAISLAYIYHWSRPPALAGTQCVPEIRQVRGTGVSPDRPTTIWTEATTFGWRSFRTPKEPQKMGKINCKTTFGGDIWVNGGARIVVDLGRHPRHQKLTSRQCDI